MEILTPPALYDHEFVGKLIEQHFLSSEIDSACDLKDVLACAFPWPDFCVIVLPKKGPGGVGPRTFALLRRHEMAHCNGWPRNHPKE